MSARRKPLHAICRQCRHLWVLLYQPMPLEAAARAMVRATCPNCAATAGAIDVARPDDVAGTGRAA